MQNTTGFIMQNKLIASFLILSSSLSAFNGDQTSHSIQTTVFKDLREGKTNEFYIQTKANLVDIDRDVETGLSKFHVSTNTSFDWNAQKATANQMLCYSNFQVNPDLFVQGVFSRFDTEKSYLEYTGAWTRLGTAIFKNIDLGNHKFRVGLGAYAALTGTTKAFYVVPRLAYLYNFDEDTFLSIGYVDSSIVHVSHSTLEGKLTAKMKLLELEFLHQEAQFVPSFKNEIALSYKVSSNFSAGLSAGVTTTERINDFSHSIKTVTDVLANTCLLPHAGIGLQASW